MKQSQVKVFHPQPRAPANLNLIGWASLVAVAVFLLVSLAPMAGLTLPLFTSGDTSASKDASASELYSPDAARRELAIQMLGQKAKDGSGEAVAGLAEFFQRDEYLVEHGLAAARAIAAADTRAAYHVLIQGFRQDKTTTRRHAAMSALEDSGPKVTPLLIAALKDPDPGVRSTSAELLGFRHDLAAATALTAATYDADASVRSAAIWALGGELAVWNALGRSQLLATSDPDEQVRESAKLAEERIRTNMARVLGIDASALLLVSVAPANGLIYAATADTLYVIRDGANWRVANVLPARPTALAVGGRDGQVVYLGTFGSGPFRSDDGGKTWKQIRTGLPAAERLTVDSLVITAGAEAEAQHVTMELSATFGTTELHTTPLGTFVTGDGGYHWTQVAARKSAHQNAGAAPLTAL